MRTVTKDQLVKIVAAAMLARNQADKLVNAKTKRVSPAKFPGTALLNFQTLDGTLTKDNYYGPNVVAALKWYLQKASDPHVPLADAKYDHIAVTWQAPSLYEPAKPATAAAVPTPKPVAKPAAQTAVTKPAAPVVIKPVAKPVTTTSKPISTVTSKPSPAPAPAPAPKPSSSFSNLSFPAVSSPQLKQIAAAVKPTKAPAKAPVKKPAAVAVQKAAPKPPAYGQEKVLKTNKYDAEDIIAEKAAAASSAAIQKINQKMIKAALQKQATSEHKNINKELAFKRAVLQQLNSIQKKIAARGGPSNAIERRIVGLVI